jgi:hypothetical protein
MRRSATCALEQAPTQPLPGLGQIGERRAIPECPGLTLNQREVVWPVIAGLTAIEPTLVTNGFAFR